MLFSVGLLGEHLSGRTGVGFAVTMVGVTLYKLVPKGPPKGSLFFFGGGGGGENEQGTYTPGFFNSAWPHPKHHSHRCVCMYLFLLLA